MMRDPDYTEAAVMLRDLLAAAWRKARRIIHRGRHRCGRSLSSYQLSEDAIAEQRWALASLPSFLEFAPIPDEVLPAPVSPPMYPAAIDGPRLRLALGWREETGEVPVARMGQPIPVGVA